MIVTAFPEMVPIWDLEVTPGVSLPLYEGARVCGHAQVLWRREIALPPSDTDVARFRAWLTNPLGPEPN